MNIKDKEITKTNFWLALTVVILILVIVDFVLISKARDENEYSFS